jgi:hypothetical protein
MRPQIERTVAALARRPNRRQKEATFGSRRKATMSQDLAANPLYLEAIGSI